MRTLTLCARLGAVLAAIGAMTALRAEPAASIVPLASAGDGLATGPPVPLCSSALIVPARGPDGIPTTADDRALLVMGLATLPATTTVLATPYLSGTRPLVRLAASRALACSAGADGTWGTGDDALLRLGSLGFDNEVDTIPVPLQADDPAGIPEPLGADAVVLAVPGDDGLFATADDEIALVYGLDLSPEVHRLEAPWLAPGARSKPVCLSPALFVVSACGEDAIAGTADDELHVFKDLGLGLGFTRTSHPVPGMGAGPAGRAVRMSSTRVLVVGAGADLAQGTSDDVVLRIDDLGGLPQVTPVAVGWLASAESSSPARLAEDRGVVVGMGPDGVAGTDDDRLVGLTALDGIPVVEILHEVAMGYGLQCRPQRLGSRSCALAAPGPDRAWDTPDDELIVTAGLGLTAVTSHVTVGGLADGVTSQPCALSADAVLVSTGGADGDIGGGADDAILLVRGLGGLGVGGDAEIESIPASGDFDGCCTEAHRPRSMGGTRAALLAGGPDGLVGSGGDDRVQVLDGVPAGLGLEVRRLRLRNRSKGGESIRLRARLHLGEPTDLAGLDLLVCLGECAQTIPGEAIRWKRNGNFQYRDRKAAEGFVQELRYQARRELLIVNGRAENTGAGHSEQNRLRFTFQVADEVAGEEMILEDTRKGHAHDGPPHGKGGPAR